MKPANPVFAFTLVSTAVLALGPRAQEKPATPDAANAPARLAISSQAKTAADVDIVLALVHSPGAGKCAQDAGKVCEAGDHWQAEVKLGGKAGAEKPSVFAITKREELKKHLEWAASPKARTKHADRVNTSDATLSLRVGPQTPYSLVQGLLVTAAKAGIHRIEFAVVPGAGAVEQRLAVPLPMDEGAQISEAKEKQGLRIALLVDQATGECVRQFDKSVIKKGEAGDLELRGKLEQATDKKAPVIVDAAKGVPWQAVVGAIDACHAAGRSVQFANPDFDK